MAVQRKMVNLAIEETSGVDHPAHLHEGWIVMKSADAATVTDILDTLTAPTNQEDIMSDVNGTDERLAEALDELAKAEDVVAETETAEEPVAEEAAADEAVEAEEVVEPAEEPAEKAAEPVSDEDFLKSAPESVIKMVESLRADKATAEEALRKERDERADAEAVSKAASQFASLAIDPAKVGPALRHLATIDSMLAKAVEDALVSANNQMESANIFAEIGKAQSGTSGSAWDKIDSIAKSYVTTGVEHSMESAVAKALADNPALYNEYLNEKGA